MKPQGAPFDASEPPRGDFVRYVEGLNAASARQAATEAAGHASRARQAQAETDVPRPAAASAAETASRALLAAAQHRQSGAQSGTQSGAQAPARRPASWGPPSTLGRASVWMIGAGIALVLLAVLSSNSAFVDTFLPGMLLIGAGLAFRRHFRKR